jgi:hypothetical protein
MFSTLHRRSTSTSPNALLLSDCTLVHLTSSLRDPQVVLPTIVSGLQVYFDKALGSNLLYRFERPQYAEIRKRYVTGPTVQVSQEREMSAIYGAEHLLRMIGLSPLLPFVTQSAAYNAVSELASDGGGVYYGPGERRLGEGLRNRAHGVSAPVILARLRDQTSEQ